jgi:sarcinarray family protein
MKPIWLMPVLVLVLLSSILPGEACGRSIKAYFNGQEATVTGIELSPGEPFTVDLYMTPDGESYAYAEIDEPGFPRAYDRREGDAIRPTACKSCNASHPAHYRWVMAPSGAWSGGIAPLKIYYQMNDPGESTPSVSGLFTVMEAYIAPATPAPAVPYQPTARAPAGMPWPGFTGVALALTAATVAMELIRKKSR